jgi:hypothetical protein
MRVLFDGNRVFIECGPHLYAVDDAPGHRLSLVLVQGNDMVSSDTPKAQSEPGMRGLSDSIRGECIEHGWSPSDDQVKALLRLFKRRLPRDQSGA